MDHHQANKRFPTIHALITRMKVIYRIKQFERVLFANPSEAGLLLMEEHLNKEQLSLFKRMHPSEQAHSIRVLQALVNDGHDDPNLCVAALLHDVGKVTHPLSVWGRIVIVLAKWLIPQKVKTWGTGNPSGWKRAFVIAENHADWGVLLAQDVGCTETVIRLIKYHDKSTNLIPDSLRKNPLLDILKKADSKN